MTSDPAKQAESDNRSEKSTANRIQLPEGQGGILSDSDRRFLLRNDPSFPELEWEGNESQKRWRIREKVKTAFQDFQLLNELELKEKNLIFDDILEDGYLPERLEKLKKPSNQILASRRRQMSYYNPSALGDQYDHLQEAIRFLYTACEIQPGPSFERLLEDSIERHILANNDESNTKGITDVTVNVTIEEDVRWNNLEDVNKLEAKLEKGKNLTRKEIGELFLQGRIKPGDLSKDDIDG